MKTKLSPRKNRFKKEGHVCLFTSSHPVDYSRFFDRESISLKQAGYRVTLIGTGGKLENNLIQGIKTISVPQKNGVKKISLLRNIAQIAYLEHADVYQALDPWCLAIGLWLKKQRPSIKLIYESNEWYPRMYLDRGDFPFFLRWLGWLIVTYLEYEATKKADEILETNPLRAQRFIRRNRIPVQIPNYAPLELIGEPLPKREPWFCYTGLICRPRGFPQLLKALKMVKTEFPMVRLLVRGEFDPRDNIKQWTEEFLLQNRLTENVVFIPKTPFYSELLKTLKFCLAGVILLQRDRGNDWTNQPNKLFEFMGCGLAVIASDFPEIARVIEESNCGWLIDPTQPAAIAAALTMALRKPEEAIRRGLAGREAAEKKYNWKIAETTLLKTYKRLLNIK